MSRLHALNFSKSKKLTKQSFRDECNINNIMKKWKRTGVIEHMAEHPPRYGDFESVDDYQRACNMVISAQASFDALPASIRDRMHNSPARFMAFMNDPANEAEARELGLLMKADPVPPVMPGDPPTGATASGVEPTPPSPAPSATG